jgi:hypothetical protein
MTQSNSTRRRALSRLTALVEIVDGLGVARHALVDAADRSLSLQSLHRRQALGPAAQDLDIEALGVDLQVRPGEADALAQGGQHAIKGAHRHGLGVIGDIEAGIVADPVVVGLEERAELVGDHDVDLHRAFAAAERVALDVPVAVAAAALAQRLDMTAQRLEGHDRAGVLDPFAQEIVILAGVGADIEHAIDLETGQQLAQMKREVPLLHLPQRHDVVAERAAHLEHGVLHDLEHAVSTLTLPRHYWFGYWLRILARRMSEPLVITV